MIKQGHIQNNYEHQWDIQNIHDSQGYIYIQNNHDNQSYIQNNGYSAHTILNWNHLFQIHANDLYWIN